MEGMFEFFDGQKIFQIDKELLKISNEEKNGFFLIKRYIGFGWIFSYLMKSEKIKETLMN